MRRVETPQQERRKRRWAILGLGSLAVLLAMAGMVAALEVQGDAGANADATVAADADGQAGADLSLAAASDVDLQLDATADATLDDEVLIVVPCDELDAEFLAELEAELALDLPADVAAELAAEIFAALEASCAFGDGGDGTTGDGTTGDGTTGDGTTGDGMDDGIVSPPTAQVPFFPSAATMGLALAGVGGGLAIALRRRSA